MHRTFQNRTIVILITTIISVVLISTLFPFAGADAPVLTYFSFLPLTNDVDSPLNISVTFTISGEPIAQVMVQSCHGDLCDLPAVMGTDGSGTTFYKEYPANYFGNEEVFIYFHFFIEYGVSSSIVIPLDPESHEYNITLKRVPKALLLTSEIDRTVLFPKTTVTVSGRVENDLGQNVSGAEVILTDVGTTNSNLTLTDQGGNFSISLLISETGNRTLNLTVSNGDLQTYKEWEVRVDSWPLPKLQITGELTHQGTDLPPGSDGSLLYTGMESDITYQVKNMGSGDAYNVTVVILDLRTGMFSNVSIDTLQVSQTYEGHIFPDPNSLGVATFMVNASFDQMAPIDLKVPVEPFTIMVTYIPKPVWTGHRPFIEMFTQTTCVPCVYMEEALERLHRTYPEDMSLLLYVFEDDASVGVFERSGITSTPEVLIDRTYGRIKGVPTGENVSSLMDLVNGSIEDASSREAPPLVIDLSPEGTNTTVSVHLMTEYTQNFSGLIQVYEVETFSNLRNNIGLPITNRFMGTAGGLDILDLRPGSGLDLIVKTPLRGRSLIAVVFALDGSAVQSASLYEGLEPTLYVNEDAVLATLDVPGSTVIQLGLERFPFDYDTIGDVTYKVEITDLPANWSIGPAASGPWTNGSLSMTFSKAAATRTVLSVGRVRLNTTIRVHLKANGRLLKGEEGLRELTLLVRTLEVSYNVTLLVDLKDGGDPLDDTPTIVEYYLKGEGLSIFFYVRAINVTSNDIVRGRVVPCLYGDDARCGVPKDLTLALYSGDLYRASVQGDDLFEFTHLTYNAWIEVDGNKTNETEPRTVAIKTLIDLTSDDDDNDDDDGNGMVLIVVLSIIAILVLIALAFLLFALTRRSGQGKEEGPGTDVHQQDGTINEEIKGSDQETPTELSGTLPVQTDGSDIDKEGPEVQPPPVDGPTPGPISVTENDRLVPPKEEDTVPVDEQGPTVANI